jgi:hypothetical protein
MIQAGEQTAGMVDSGTQFAFLSWLVAFVLVYRKFNMENLVLMWPVLPWMFWMTLTNGVGFLMNPDLLKSLAFSIMAAQLAGASGGQFVKCLLGLGLGLLVVSVGFWANEAGLPVQLMNWGGERGGFERIGGVVVDSVMLWPAILTGLGALIGVAAFAQSRGKPVQSRWTKIIAFGGFFISLVPMISAMTNSAILGLGVILAAYGASAFGFGRRGSGQQASRNSPVLLLVGLVGVAAVVVVTDAFNSQQKLEGLWLAYEEQSEEMGAIASRNEVWECSIDTISRYPLFGHVFSGGVEKLPAQYVSRGYYLSHNVFLDFGRKGGIPGMLMFGYFLFYPVILALRTGRAFYFRGFLLTMLAQLLFFLSLSFWTYKPFWAFWMLFMVAADDTSRRIALAKWRGLSRKWRSLGFELPADRGHPVLGRPDPERV